jgi:hypothetical protein
MVNVEELAEHIVEAFEDFSSLPFIDRRDHLREAVREVVVTNHAITGVTLADVRNGAKSCKPSRFLRLRITMVAAPLPHYRSGTS